MTVRFETLRREAFLNVTSAPVRSALLAVSAFVAAVALVLVSSLDLASIASREAEMVASGAYIYRVQVAQGVPALTCDRLRYNDGIQDAGAILSQSQGSLREIPASSIQRVVATPGYLRIVWKDPFASAARSLAGSALAEAYGIRRGVDLTFIDDAGATALQVGTIAAPTTRVVGANQLVATPSPPIGNVQECIVEAKPGAMSAVATYLASVFGPQAVISPLVQPRESTDDLLHHRLTLWSPVLIPLAVGVLAFTSQYGRRADLALYRLLGARRRDLFILTYLEAAFVLFTPFSIGVYAAVFLLEGRAPLSPIVSTFLANDIARAWWILVAVPVAMAIPPGRRTALAWLKGQ